MWFIFSSPKKVDHDNLGEQMSGMINLSNAEVELDNHGRAIVHLIAMDWARSFHVNFFQYGLFLSQGLSMGRQKFSSKNSEKTLIG